MTAFHAPDKTQGARSKGLPCINTVSVFSHPTARGSKDVLFESLGEDCLGLDFYLCSVRDERERILGACSRFL